MRRYQYVLSYGALYRLTVKQWHRWLLSHARGAEPSILDFGGTLITENVVSIVDLYPNDALDQLDLEGALPKEKLDELRTLRGKT